jgi:hypothetical protein
MLVFLDVSFLKVPVSRFVSLIRVGQSGARSVSVPYRLEISLLLSLLLFPSTFYHTSTSASPLLGQTRPILFPFGERPVHRAAAWWTTEVCRRRFSQQGETTLGDGAWWAPGGARRNHGDGGSFGGESVGELDAVPAGQQTRPLATAACAPPRPFALPPAVLRPDASIRVLLSFPSF